MRRVSKSDFVLNDVTRLKWRRVGGAALLYSFRQVVCPLMSSLGVKTYSAVGFILVLVLILEAENEDEDDEQDESTPPFFHRVSNAWAGL